MDDLCSQRSRISSVYKIKEPRLFQSKKIEASGKSQRELIKCDEAYQLDSRMEGDALEDTYRNISFLNNNLKLRQMSQDNKSHRPSKPPADYYSVASGKTCNTQPSAELFYRQAPFDAEAMLEN